MARVVAYSGWQLVGSSFVGFCLFVAAVVVYSVYSVCWSCTAHHERRDRPRLTAEEQDYSRIKIRKGDARLSIFSFFSSFLFSSILFHVFLLDRNLTCASFVIQMLF